MTDHAAIVRNGLYSSPGGGPNEKRESALAALDALIAERDAARDSNAVFMSGEAYSRMHDAWHAETDRAEAAEAEVARLKEISDSMTGPAKIVELRAERDEARQACSDAHVAAMDLEAERDELKAALDLSKERATLILRISRDSGIGAGSALSKIEHEAEHWLGLASLAAVSPGEKR